MADLNSPKTPTAAPESSAAHSVAPERSAPAESAALGTPEREAVGTTQSSAAQSSAVESSAVQNSTAQSCAVEPSAAQSSAAQGSAAESSAAQGSAAESSAAQTTAAASSAASSAAAAGAGAELGAGAEREAQTTQRSVWREIWSKRMGICVVTGFASGMPLFVLINLLAAYLRKEGLDLKVIGIFSLMTMPYTWKFVWAPIVDRYQIFHLGRRKDWILLSQIVLIIAIAAMGWYSPQEHIGIIATLAIVVAFASATQDIVLDAYRREFLPTYELGLGNAIFVNAYRVAGLVPGGISLILADYVSWTTVFIFTAACLVPCLVLTIFLREQEIGHAPRSLKEAVVEPFAEFIGRRGVKAALFTVCFVFLYKIGDSMALALATPFYMDLGYDLTTIGIVAKNVGLWSTVVGGLLGGVFMLKLGINRALWILALVLIGEYGGGGLGTAAFVAFLAKETNPAYTATQLALLTSFSAIPRTFCNATTGYLVEGLGWENFFLFCTVLAVPGMLLLFKVAPWSAPDEARRA